MATLNGNNAYLSFNGTVLSTYWTKELSREATVDTEDITAGAGATHIERAPKLIDNTMTFMVVHDDSTFATYRAALVVGTTGTLVYGPENNTAGKPRFEGSMILTSVSQPQTIDKGLVSYELSFEQAAAPTYTIEGGSTF